MIIQFIKGVVLGNDFILIDIKNLPETFYNDDKKLSKLAINLCLRKQGIGADGLVVLDTKIPYTMSIYNKDGSRAELCVNALFLFSKFLFTKFKLSRGIINVTAKEFEFQIKTEDPFLIELSKISYDLNPKIINPEFNIEKIFNYPLTIQDKKFKLNLITISNPHAVIFYDDLNSLDLNTYGQQIEHYEKFPNRINVEFVNVIDKNNICVRFWERGVGETLSCGTGTCAASVISNLLGYCDNEIKVLSKGGEVFVTIDKSNQISITGKPNFVFEGTIEI